LAFVVFGPDVLKDNMPFHLRDGLRAGPLFNVRLGFQKLKDALAAGYGALDIRPPYGDLLYRHVELLRIADERDDQAQRDGCAKQKAVAEDDVAADAGDDSHAHIAQSFQRGA